MTYGSQSEEDESRTRMVEAATLPLLLNEAGESSGSIAILLGFLVVDISPVTLQVRQSRLGSAPLQVGAPLSGSQVESVV